MGVRRTRRPAGGDADPEEEVIARGGTVARSHSAAHHDTGTGAVPAARLQSVGGRLRSGVLAGLLACGSWSAAAAGAAPVVTVEPAEVAQGSYVVIRASGLPAGRASARAFGVRIPLFPDGAGLRGIAAVPLAAAKTRHAVSIEYGRRKRSVSVSLRVGPRSERVTTRRVGLSISSDANEKMKDDRADFLRALRTVAAEARWDGPLRRPVFGRVSSPFGITRSYRGTASWPHRGLDLAAPMGWPIVAAAPGRVVYSGFLGTYGNLVVLDHGQTVHTSYLHMSVRAVRAGDWACAGQVLGTIGMTGLATGPHLHFGTHIGVTAVDPEEMLRRGLP